ncbi:flavin-dependent oxidoreductase [Pseudonocardia dioxanivorans]|jgi:2-polyprenyl-6-methoxyphenol hydroxylase-like FAD-dependent oxidoreductase|uniref:flavin-dependent oxidoreductase n=1 Tax=Pseudonocardia dioxanivorans TaxID=240495 RepID=UPI000CD132A2|nr:flavin-dependent oxidoreductase [Pseudonocardia dioxanivorans]
MSTPHDVLIVGGGIGGLTLALQLHRAGVPCRVVEEAPELRALGVGINILPHASRELHRLGLGPELDRIAVRTREAVFYNRFGQLVYSEPVGAAAGYEWPQYSVHRGDLQLLLVDAVRARLGEDAIALGRRVVEVRQDDRRAVAVLEDEAGRSEESAEVLIGCDGVRSVVRATLYPQEGPPRYSGCTMWRGATLAEPFLTGASMVRAGWLSTGKMVIYPIRDDVNGTGKQLINWVAELETEQRSGRDWNRDGALEDVIVPFEDWHFDWLDVPALIRGTERILEYPMVDQDPLPRWSFGRISLLGDAAHPMVPRGSNGAGQAILDTRVLTERLIDTADPVEALRAYDEERREATSAVVRLNRTNPPDAILREVYERTGDKPFARIEDVMSDSDFEAVLGRYRTVAGYSREALAP